MVKRHRGQRLIDPATWADGELHRIGVELDTAIRDIRSIRRDAERRIRDLVGRELLVSLTDQNGR
jgi:hypothetical protein